MLLHKKVRWGHEIAPFTTKRLNFSRLVLKLVGKNLNWGDPRSLVVNINIIANCCSTHVLLHSKNAKRNWNWINNRLCVIIFIIDSISIEGRVPDPLAMLILMITVQLCSRTNYKNLRNQPAQGSYARVLNFILILCSNEPNFYAFFMIFSLILGLFYAQCKINDNYTLS